MGDAAAVLLDGRLLAVVGVLVLGAVSLSRTVGRRLRISDPHAIGLIGTTGIVLAVTLLNRSGGPFDIARVLRWEPYRWFEYRRPDYLLNLALMAPAAALWAAAVRRPLTVIGVGFAASLSIEIAQSLGRLGTGDQADLVANTIGTIVGALAGSAWARHLGSSERRGWSQRQLVVVAVGTVVAATLSVVAIGAEADQRSELLVELLAGTLGDANSRDLAPVLEQDPDDALEQFRATATIRADSIRYLDGPDHVDVRYPLEFLGARRCVFADISPAGTTLRQAAGRACIERRD